MEEGKGASKGFVKGASTCLEDRSDTEHAFLLGILID
jgi:hypothetical protein